MAKRNITIDVDFAKKDILTKFTIKQFDNATITINTFSSSIAYNPTGNTCKLFVGIDNDLFLQENNIQVQENKIIIELDRNMISKSGMAYAELELKDSNDVMTSSTFIFTVETKLGEGANIPGNVEGFVERYERLINEFKSNVDTTVKDCNTRVDNKLIQLQEDYDTTKNEVVKKTDDKIVDIENRFNELTASQQQDSEVIDARDGEISLPVRLDRDLKLGSTVMKEVEGTYISTETTEGEVQDLIIEGNTYQDSTDLSIIKSSGELQENGTYKLSFLCRGKNLDKYGFEIGGLSVYTGKLLDDTNTVRSKDFIYIKSLTDLVCSLNEISKNITWLFYDIDKNYISYHSSVKNPIIPNNAHYCKLYTIDKALLGNSQLEEGTQATQYEPYQEYIQDIYLPCPIERVGNVADRLMCRNGVWGVEKNNILFKPPIDKWELHPEQAESFLSVWAKNIILPNSVEINNVYCKSNAIAKGFIVDKKDTTGEVLSIHQLNGVNWVYARVGNSKANTLEQFKESIANNIEIIYQAKEPQFIPLSDDQQVKLKTFMSHTNIVSLNEIPPVIKGKVPNSLKDTVSSNVKSIDRIDKQLQNTVSELVETTGYEYKSENNYINIKNSKAGTLDNVRVEGNTIINIASNCFNNTQYYQRNSDETINIISEDTTTPVSGGVNELTNIILNKQYKLILNKNIRVLIRKIASGTVLDTIYTEPIVFTPTEPIYLKLLTDGKLEYPINNVECMIIEDTQSIPTHFEGLKSVGELEELEITSVNENLFTKKFMTEFETKHNFDSDGNVILNGKWYAKFDLSHIKNTNTIYIYYEWEKLVDYSSEPYITVYDQCDVKAPVVKEGDYRKYTSTNGFKDINFFVGGGVLGECKFSNIMISTEKREFVPHKSDKKKLLFKDSDDTWKPVVLRKWDYIEELADGRCKYHRGSGEDLLDGSRNWRVIDANPTTTMQFRCDSISGLSVISDKFKTIDLHNTSEDEYCFIRTGDMNIKIKKDKLETQDVVGFKKWLQANNITIVYQLAQEEVYDCIDLSLNSFNNETSVFTNSSIPHKLTVTQKQGLKARVETLEQEMKFLYDNFNYALKQVLAGNKQELAYILYPQDFTDYNSNSDNTNEDIPVTIPEL